MVRGGEYREVVGRTILQLEEHVEGDGLSDVFLLSCQHETGI
jgi:hypothetical protein